ncbi:MAG: PBP1A family penicillin-binding protein [Treponema sp.]|nr:PBP1A family penicillin-binding protein [Treponema sp.]MCL2250767.1 PBP1A family penicillin-binding protein [Treponema sp.]
MGRNGGNNFISSLVVKLIVAFTIVLVIIIGVGLGLSLAVTANIRNQENFAEFVPALPTKILDINGVLITEFASDEKREMVALSELPRHLIHAVLSREDPDFYNHRGFSIRGIARAAMGQLTGRNLGGGSTITQQVAGTLYTNRNERTINRKIRELWWSFQIERRYTKNEILEIYLNYMPMGPGTYGVETASKYFFGHSSRDVSIAEAAVLAVLLSGPSRFDPLKNPSLAMNRQHAVLERMIQFGYADKDEAEASFNEYWENFDWTRPPLSAYLTRDDKAPWFSEYVRRELDAMMYGTMDYFRDGYIVHTTLNLTHQEAAVQYMSEGIKQANVDYNILYRRGNVHAERAYLPIIDLLTLAFDITDIREVTSNQNETRAISRYNRTINPIVDMMALTFGVHELKDITNPSYARLRENTQQNVVEGALVAIENETGYITAIVGGSKFDESNQLIRASQANVQTGSAIKPLYYSAALDSKKFTAATLINDIPMVFYNEDNTPYIPDNYGGLWRGPVLLYNALSLSLNIPSLYLLEAIGFDAAIDRSASLLGYTDEATIRRLFPRVYPLGLGITSTSPLRMARAFAIFANQGRDVTPIAIRTVEDRNGGIVFDVERSVRQRQQRMGNRNQIVSPQNAYVMTRLMEFATTIGTLAAGAGYGRFVFQDENGRSFRIPVAGKTGTTQNWSDAWTVGYTPYYTTAVWFGFDMPGNSLGNSQTGAGLAAPVWGDTMREIHRGLPQKGFSRPSSGVIDITVCRKSGRLRTPNCNEGEVTLPFLEGTIPSMYCDIHSDAAQQIRLPISSTMFGINDSSLLDSLPPMPTLPLDLFPELQSPPPRNNTQNRGTTNRTTTRNTGRTTTNTNTNNRNQSNIPSVNNPFLDDDLPPAVNEAPSAPINQPVNQPINEPVNNNDAVLPNNTVQFIPNNDDENEDSDLPSWNPLE